MADTILIDLLGRSITLHDHTWFGHVLKGHPEMHNRRADVEGAITQPQWICYSTSAFDCRVYYAPDASTGLLIAAVANVVHGYVKTAYLARSTKGTVEW
jgi:hypothetical protein